MKKFTWFLGGQKRKWFQLKSIFVFLEETKDVNMASLVLKESLRDIDSESAKCSACIIVWNELEWQMLEEDFGNGAFFDVKYDGN